MHRDKARQNDATRDMTGATLVATARALSVSVRTVQRRIKAGELSVIERDGRRLVLLPGDGKPGATSVATVTRHATKSATVDATERDTTGEMLEHLKTENAFLRGVVEQLQRDGAETRAALRKALENQPRQLMLPTSPEPPQGPKNARAAPTMPAPVNAPQKGKDGNETASYGALADWLESEGI